MKTLILCTLVLAHILCHAQNVGIGTPSPGEKLDVNGNINLTGTIKTNNTDGTPGQVLMKNSSSALSWGNIGDFKNVVAFTDTSVASINWNVPANVTKIWVELWGGGGAGLQAGGGGGGYLSAVFNVVPAQSVQLAVGKGGKDLPVPAGSFTSTGSGEQSRIDIAGQYYLVFGGGSAFKSTAFSFTQYTPGSGGNYSTSVSATTSPRGPFYAESGQPGGTYRNEYNSITSNQYYQHGFYGNGGAAAKTAQYGASGAYEEFLVTITPPSTFRTNHNPARSGVFPGGGGGGGPQITNDQRAGANGLVLIHY